MRQQHGATAKEVGGLSTASQEMRPESTPRGGVAAAATLCSGWTQASRSLWGLPSKNTDNQSWHSGNSNWGGSVAPSCEYQGSSEAGFSKGRPRRSRSLAVESFRDSSPKQNKPSV